MSRPIVKIHNVSTGEIINREMNDDEFAQHQKDLADELKSKARAEAKALAKSDLLAKLGITEDEAKLFLS